VPVAPRHGVDVLVSPLLASVVQRPLLEVELPWSELPSSSSLLPSDVDVEVDVDVDVDVVVVHWSFPNSSATQVFVSVVQMSLLQLVDVEVEVVPGSLARAGAASPRTRVKNDRTAAARTPLRLTVDVLIARISFGCPRDGCSRWWICSVGLRFGLAAPAGTRARSHDAARIDPASLDVRARTAESRRRGRSRLRDSAGRRVSC
jgi:hypothetical protein